MEISIKKIKEQQKENNRLFEAKISICKLEVGGEFKIKANHLFIQKLRTFKINIEKSTPKRFETYTTEGVLTIIRTE